MGTDTKEKKKESWGESVRSFLIAVAVALLFRSVAYEPFHIPSGSMLSTLYVGDYLFVSKYSYGYSRFSFPLGIPFFKGRVFGSAPERGDVVVFRLPKANHIDYIKRVIGLPGDKVQVRHGRLYLNGELVEQTRRGDVVLPNEQGENRAIPLYEEVLPNGRKHIVLDEVANGPADNTPVYTVPAGHYFMMGDNRDNSQDSRFQNEVGFVPEENLVGRAELILLSYDSNEAPLWKIWEWPNAFRAGRWFRSID